MNEYFFIMAIVVFSLANIFRKMRNRKQIGLLNEQNFEQLKKRGKEVRMASQEKYMNVFFCIFLGIAAACLWIPDPTNFHFVIGLCIFIISNCMIELLNIPQKYRLYYNDEAFVYQGAYYKFNKIKAVGYSKFFFQPAKMHFENGQSIVIFKGGLDTIHQVLAKRTPSNKKAVQ
ncbi:hypothetical protein [Bacillus massilinigeriensis]|uniref:hypothetical protein n=1 Tax=Bacillus massilionigeriensis TaxID=1805475 RepID=UPI00096AEBA1|nr:hypothetical protein [Bacillus massilionigeriensis]